MYRGVTTGGAGEEDVVKDLARISDQGIDMVLVFSQGEPGLFQLHTHYRDALDRLRRLPRFTYHEVAWSGHTFTNVRAQQTLMGLLTEHLMTAFPVSHA